MNQGPGYGPQYPPQGGPQYPQQGYPSPGYPPPKKGMSGGMIALIVVACLFGSCVVLGAIGSSADKNKDGAASAAVTDNSPAPNAFPWAEQVKQNCAAYDAAPNEIKKSAVFRTNNKLLDGVSIESARGKLTRLRTNQGGSELSIQVKADGVEFSTESLFSAIKQGTLVYEAASEMKVGDCVVFSVKKIKSSSMSERSQVCDLEYFADFTSLASCK